MSPSKPPRTERSAGVLLYRIGQAQWPEFLLLDYGRHWDFPKGHLEDSEDDVTAARRELLEETGISDVVFHDGFRFEMTYSFRDKRTKAPIQKTVIFFLGKTSAGDVRLSHEHVGAEFLPIEQAVVRATYENAKEALRAADEFLQSGSQNARAGL